MENFKIHFNIQKEITLQSKVEDSHLYVLYNDRWIRLTRKNQEKFYSLGTLQSRYDSTFLRELGHPARKGKRYSREKYMNNRDYYREASKKYYHKMKKAREARRNQNS